ncbi:ion transporter [Vibrio natriegens]|uniref:ion transporter n=1 Tax=Vibrio natriegens TaxID=691 RepID=UPI0035579CE2
MDRFVMKTHSLKNTLYVTIFGTHTKAGRTFDIVLIIAILSSLAVLVLDSIPAVQAEWAKELKYLEYTFTGLFTIEYLLRLYCSPKPAAYAKSFYGIVDLLAILPTYLVLFFPSASFMGVIRALRVLRIFRILKLVRYLQDSNVLLRSLLMARRKIFIFFSAVAILVTIFGSLIYIVEGPENGFTSIPKSIYWAIVTITTVGYGDLVPQTNLGKALASITMLLGYSIIAVPTGIFTAELHQEIQSHKELVKCPNCSQAGHDPDAIYCKHCGSELADPDKRVVRGESKKRAPNEELFSSKIEKRYAFS